METNPRHVSSRKTRERQDVRQTVRPGPHRNMEAAAKPNRAIRQGRMHGYPDREDSLAISRVNSPIKHALHALGEIWYDLGRHRVPIQHDGDEGS